MYAQKDGLVSDWLTVRSGLRQGHIILSLLFIVTHMDKIIETAYLQGNVVLESNLIH